MLTAQQPGQLARDREAEPGAAELSIGGAVGLAEGLEDDLLVLGGDADARVTHRELHVFALVVFQGAHFQRHGAALRELDRVRQQILQDLRKTLDVGVDGRRQVRRLVHAEQDLLLERHGLECVGQSMRQLADVDAGVREIDLARLDLGKIEDVVDERQQVVAGRGDAASVLDLLRREIGVAIVGQQLGEDQRAVERRAQLVRHVGQELALVAIGTHQLGRLAFEIEFRADELVVLLPELLRVFLEVHVGLFELGLLGLEPCLRVAQLRALREQFLVRDAQLLLLRLQLLGLALGFLQQVFPFTAQHAGADRDGDGLAHAGQQVEIRIEGGVQKAQLQDAMGRFVDDQRGDQQRMRLAAAEAGADLQVIRRQVLDAQRLPFDDGAAQQPVSGRHRRRQLRGGVDTDCSDPAVRATGFGDIHGPGLRAEVVHEELEHALRHARQRLLAHQRIRQACARRAHPVLFAQLDARGQRVARQHGRGPDTDEPHAAIDAGDVGGSARRRHEPVDDDQCGRRRRHEQRQPRLRHQEAHQEGSR